MTRSAIPDLLERGIRKVYFEEYDLRDKEFERLYKRTGSQKRQERDVVTAGLGLFRPKAEGNSPQFDVAQEAWLKTYLHQTYALGIEVTEEGMEDDLYSFYTGMGKELGRAAYYTQEVNAADIWNDFTQVAYTAGGVNYGLLSTSHYRVDGDTWANRPTVAFDLSIDSLETALTQWRTGMVDQRGRKIMPQPAFLVHGPSDEMLADRLLNTVQRPQSADNDVNPVKRRRNLQPFTWDFLVDDGRWFLVADKGDTGLTYFDRVGHMMRRHDDPRTGNILMVGRYRSSWGTAHVTGIYGSP
jgi:hypothetical protein